MKTSTYKFAAVAIAFGALAITAFADRTIKSGTLQVESKRTILKPVAGVRLDPVTRKPLTQWQPMSQTQGSGFVTNFGGGYIPAYDVCNSAPTGGLPNAGGYATPNTFADFYGATPIATGNIWNFGPTANWPMWADDMSLAAGTAGRVSRWHEITARIGSAPATDLILIIETFDTHSNDVAGPASSNIIDVWAWNFGVVTPGFFGFPIDFDDFLTFSASGLKLPQSATGGGYRVSWATVDSSNNIVGLPSTGIAISPGYFYSNDAADPYVSGTNPSNSDEFQWDDDTPFNYIHEDETITASLPTPYSENYSYEYTNIAGTGPGILHATAALFVNDSAPLIKGNITFSDVSGPRRNPLFADVEISDGVTTVSDVIAVSQNGYYEIYVPANGTWTVRVKSEHFLTKQAVVAVTGSATQNFTLTNADIDGDNSVTIFDYIELSNNFDKTDADLDFFDIGGAGVPKSFSDLDRDGAVTIFDYIILSNNFDVSGD